MCNLFRVDTSAAEIARLFKLGSFMWRYSFTERRCLIPLTAFAEAEGPRTMLGDCAAHLLAP